MNTTDDIRADALVAQLNILLSDRKWWSADRLGDAEREFAPQIVSAFFDGMEAGRVDTAQLRDARIGLPGRDEGYARILLVGTTGAGKTTLLRHLIGSSHERDRFPSTSTARTTIADTEIITADGDFQAAVTFMSEFEVRAHLDECIEAACLAATEGQPDAKVAAALLTHHEQRFRLSYLLGEWESDATVDDEEEYSFDPAAPAANGTPDDEDGIADDERQTNSTLIESYVSRVRALATDVTLQNAADLGVLSVQQTPDDKAAWLELFSDRLFDSEAFAPSERPDRQVAGGDFALARQPSGMDAPAYG